MFFIEFFFLGVFFMVLGGFIYIYDYIFVVYWTFGNLDIFGVLFSLYMDFYSFLFVSVVFLVSSIILLYSNLYVDLYINRFFNLMIFFVLSMLLLVFSPDFISMFLGWDGLGVVSFCLVNFYYGSNVSLNSAMITVLYNRLGDSMLIMGITLGFYYSFSVFFIDSIWMLLVSYLIMFGLMTKSAQFPFSSWLPKAMAAPTPVSSLVHSSTLVTSGLYIFFRYYSVLELVMGVLMFLSLFTMFMGGICAVFEFDIKKIIAFSTLSQIGLMVFSLSLGMVDLMFFHMLIHAIFKSLMFMCAGIIIHEFGVQDIRYLGGCFYYMPLLSLILGSSTLSLMGFPFFSGFYSKDMIIEFLLGLSNSIFIFLIYSLSLFFSIIYSCRFLNYIFYNDNLGFPYLSCSDGPMSIVVIILFIFMVFSGSFFSMILFDFNYVESLFFWGKMLVLSYFLGGVFIYLLSPLFSSGVLFFGLFFYIDSIVFYLKSMFFTKFFLFYYFDKIWLEFSLGMMGMRGLFIFDLLINWISFNLVFIFTGVLLVFMFLI